MRKALLLVALVVGSLLIFNACVAEVPEGAQEEEGGAAVSSEASTVYEAVSALFDQPVEASYTGVVKGVVVHTYYYYGIKVLIQDPDGKAGLRVELAEGEDAPSVNGYIEIYGVVRKYEREDEGVITFKLEDATYSVIEESTDLVPQTIDETFFATDNNYRMNVYVHTEGTVTKVYTGDHPAIYMDIDVGEATKNIKIYSFDSDVKDWINSQGESLVGSPLEIYGYWTKYKSSWEIVPRSPEDVPAMSE